jgi:hypothetical protein
MSSWATPPPSTPFKATPQPPGTSSSANTPAPASAYVGMTRGRTNNVAHLVADSLDQAREQWITTFSHDRADLGPGHAAHLAAAQAHRYAPHRPLPETLAELHHAWTIEQNCVDQLTHHRHLRDQLRQIIAVTAKRHTAIPPLQATYQAARLHADHATEQFDQVEATVAAHTGHITDALHRAWNDQRPAARTAAHTIQAGAGRLGQRRRAVRHAGEQLQQWADTWRPILPDLPHGLDGTAVVAASLDDTTGLHDAFTRHGRHIAERAHPGLPAAGETAHTAKATAAQAWAALQNAANHYEQQLWRYGTLARTPQPDQAVNLLDQRIIDTEQRLDQTRADLAALGHEPALRSLPTDRLTAERDTWQAHRTAQRRADIAHAARTRPSVRPRPNHGSLGPPPSPALQISR